MSYPRDEWFAIPRPKYQAIGLDDTILESRDCPVCDSTLYLTMSIRPAADQTVPVGDGDELRIGGSA